MSAFTTPILVSDAAGATELERIPLVSGAEGLFAESRLQEILFANPNCLPLAEIAPQLGRLIPVCRELSTDAGYVDLVFVTAFGQVVVVETKLWRNPEARRAVVAQILDYAKELTAWSYEDFARESARASGGDSNHLLARLRQVDPEADEVAFVDGINRSLKTGDILLVIVGDGIRTGTEALVGFLERYGNLRFAFALIELAAYRLAGQGMLLLPRILAKTEVIQRTVLMGPSGPLAFEQVARSDDGASPDPGQAAWYRAFWQEFLAQLKLDDTRQPLPDAVPKSTNLYLTLPPSGACAWISAYLAKSSGRGGVYLTFARTFDKVSDYYERLLSEREEIERSVGIRLNWQREERKIYISAPHVELGNLDVPADRARVIAYLVDMTNRFVNAFRHRLLSYGTR